MPRVNDKDNEAIIKKKIDKSDSESELESESGLEYESEISDTEETRSEYFKNGNDMFGGAGSKGYSKISVQQDVSVISSLRRSRYDELDDVDADLSDRLYPISIELKADADNLQKIRGADPSPVIQRGVDYPKFNNGFFHWIHSSKNKAIEFSKFEGKKKVYFIANGYEQYIDEYDESIGVTSAKFFGLAKNKQDIVSRNFYKIWELIHYYDLLDTDAASIKTLNISNYPGGLIQANMLFREKYSKSSGKSDHHFYLKINSDTEKDDYSDKYEEQDSKFFSTANKSSITPIKDDINSASSIKKVKSQVGDVDIIIGEGGYDWNDENTQEQLSQFTIFSEIITAINTQKKGGSFILKVYEMFTELSFKFVSILKYMYDKVFIVKPLMSRDSSSEKYLVCKGFKGDKDNQTVTKLTEVLDYIGKTSESKTSSSDFFVNIYPDYVIDPLLRSQIISSNISFTNSQFNLINKMVKFIEGTNYHGDLYRQYKERQIRLSIHWINVFLKETTKREDAVSAAKKLIEQSEKEEINKLTILQKKTVKTDYIVKDLRNKPATKPETKPETKPATKPETKPETKPATKSAKSPNKKMSRPKSKSKSKSKPKVKRVVKSKK